MPSRPLRQRLPGRCLVTLATLALISIPQSLRAQPIVPQRAGAVDAPLVAVRHGAFMLAGHPLPYLHGINYEGSSDRPWRMWQDGLFDPNLIAHDFDLMAAAGYNPVRIFIQHPLPDLILGGDFSRLDTVVNLAAARGLRLLITFNDDGDPDLARVARVERLVAAHLAGNPAVFGYDLRNEPTLIDIAGSIYPPGAVLPLLSPALIAAYGERVSMRVVNKVYGKGVWASGGFAAFDRTKLYRYLNARALLSAFLNANPSYPSAPVAPYWRRFLDLANRTLSSYLYVQLSAIHAVDPAHLITVGYHVTFWAALPANGALDFRSIHIYPPADFAGFHAALRRFEALNAQAATPLVLEEFGVSNDLNGRQTSAIREMAVSLYLRTLGGAGDIKWMFSDDAVGFNAYENNLGAVDSHDVPKPTYLASAAANGYWSRSGAPGGLVVQPDPLTGAGFVFMARDGLAIGGSQPYVDARVRYVPSVAGIVWLDWSTPGVLRIMPTAVGTLTIKLGALTGATALLSLPAPVPATPLPAWTATPGPAPAISATATTTGTGQTQQMQPAAEVRDGTPPGTATPLTGTVPATTVVPAAITPTAAPAAGAVATNGLTVTLHLQAGVPLRLTYAAPGTPPAVPIDLPQPPLENGWYILARGHNVAPPFLKPWQTLGADAVIGWPLTEQFAYRGLPTQYFDTVALRIGPQGLTTAPIGTVALNGARPAARELPRRIPHVYDRVTGHNIHGFFLDFWRRYGGVRFWGHPLTEEMRENGHVVQYFEGAEFMLVNTVGSHVDVDLAPLGRRMWPRIRAVYGL